MNRTAFANISPRFFGRKSENGRKQRRQGFDDFAHRALGRPPARRVDRVAIHPILGDIDVKTAEVDRTELIECLVDLVKLVRRVGRATFIRHLLQAI